MCNRYKIGKMSEIEKSLIFFIINLYSAYNIQVNDDFVIYKYFKLFNLIICCGLFYNVSYEYKLQVCLTARCKLDITLIQVFRTKKENRHDFLESETSDKTNSDEQIAMVSRFIFISNNKVGGRKKYTGNKMDIMQLRIDN